MGDPRSRLGRYEDNPARQDVEEIGRMIGVHFALNAILNEDKQIVDVVAGEPVAVMQKGIPLVRKLYETLRSGGTALCNVRCGERGQSLSGDRGGRRRHARRIQWEVPSS